MDSPQDVFLFSNDLKVIEPELTPEQSSELTKWNSENQLYQANRQSFELNKDNETALALQSAIDRLKKSEVQLNTTLSAVYLQLPDPGQFKNNWDWGKKEKQCQERIHALESMKTYTESVYIQAKKDDKVVEDFLNGGSTPDPDQGESSVETTLILMNNTPYDMSLTGFVMNEKQWAKNSGNRPDKNISGPLKLKPFSTTHLKEDLADDANAANFTVEVTTIDQDSVTGKDESQSLMFTANQYLAITPPIIGEDESLQEGLPPNTQLLDTTNAGFWVIQQFFEKSKKTLSLAITETRKEG